MKIMLKMIFLQHIVKTLITYKSDLGATGLNPRNRPPVLRPSSTLTLSSKTLFGSFFLFTLI